MISRFWTGISSCSRFYELNSAFQSESWFSDYYISGPARTRSPRALSRRRRRRRHLRSPRALDRPRLAALLAPFGRCGACVVGAGSRPLALRVRQGIERVTGAVALPFPGSRGPRVARPRAPGRRAVGRPAGSGNRKRASATRRRPRPQGACRSHHGARAGRFGATSTPLEPPRTNARDNQPQGGTERGRSLDPVRRRKHRSRASEVSEARSAASVRPKAERRKSQPGTASEASRMPGPSSGTQPVERAGAFYPVLSWRSSR